MSKGEQKQMASVIDKAAAFVEDIFHHSFIEVVLRGSSLSKADRIS
jgi:hypothetical protein